MKYQSKTSKQSPSAKGECGCNTFTTQGGLRQEPRNLMGVNPMKEQFAPTDAEPIRQRARMAGVCH